MGAQQVCVPVLATGRSAWRDQAKQIAHVALFASVGVTSSCLAQGVIASLDMAQLQSHAGDQILYLQVTVNGRPTRGISQFSLSGETLQTTLSVLRLSGLDAIGAGLPDDTPIRLNEIEGLQFKYHPNAQRIDLQVPDSMRRPTQLDTRGRIVAEQATSASGLVLNYDAYGQTESSAHLAVWSDLRHFNKNGVFSNSGTVYAYDQTNRYVRFDTYWARSNAEDLSTIQVGDTISSSLDWSRSIRLGGFQWRSNFALRPGLVTFPMPSFAGSSAVPSSVDLFVNGTRQFSGNVPGGPFVINQMSGLTGAGEASVVTRDALGRSVTTVVPLYIDSRLLNEGLSSHSVEVGFLRRNYGRSSFDYNSRPATSMSWRHGVSNAFTFESHAEATPGLFNVGVGGLLRLGQAGVINGSVSGSTGHRDMSTYTNYIPTRSFAVGTDVDNGYYRREQTYLPASSLTGTQYSAGYQYISQRASFTVRTTRAQNNYGDLAARDGTPSPKAIDQATVSVPMPALRGTASLSYIGYRTEVAPPAHIASLGYTMSLSGLATVRMNAFKDFGERKSTGVYLGLSIMLGNRISTNISAGRQNGRDSYGVSASRSPGYEGGWGWGAQSGRSGDLDYTVGEVKYRGAYGELSAIARSYDGKSSGALGASGSVVLMDGAVRAARKINDGFTLVSTEGVAGVPVLRENRTVGYTDSGGYFLVPDLNSYQNNRIAINPANLPADARILETRMNIVPQALSGVLARFSVSRYTAASVILHDIQGQPLPVGSAVRQVESGATTIVGYDGLAFVDGLQAHNTLIVRNDEDECSVQFDYARPTDGGLPTLGPLTCEPKTRGSTK